MDALRTLALLATLLAAASSEVVPNLGEENLDKGMVFLEQGKVLLSGEVWTLVLNYDISYLTAAIGQYLFFVGEASSYYLADSNTENRNNTGLIRETLAEELKVLHVQANKMRRSIDTLRGTLEPRTRNKRSLFNLGGMLLRVLFGTATVTDLGKINRKIDSLAGNMKEIIHVVGDQMTFMNRTKMILDRHRNLITKLAYATSGLGEHLRELQKTFEARIFKLREQLNLVYRLSSTMRIFETLLGEIRQEITLFNQALDLTSMGKLSSYFITPAELSKLLREINLPAGLSFLTGVHTDEVYKYYVRARVHAATLGSILRIYVELPLKSPSLEFELYKAVELPTAAWANDTFVTIKPEKPYFAISSDRLRYAELADSELRDCGGKYERICDPVFPIYSSNVHTCLFALYSRNSDYDEKCTISVIADFPPKFYMLSDKRKWIFSVPKPVEATMECAEDGNFPYSLTLKGTGTIEIPTGCSIYSPTFRIHAHLEGTTSYNSTRELMHIPPIKGFTPFSLEPLSIDEGITDLELNELRSLAKSVLSEDTSPASLPIYEFRQRFNELRFPSNVKATTRSCVNFPFVLVQIVFDVFIGAYILYQTCIQTERIRAIYGRWRRALRAGAQGAYDVELTATADGVQTPVPSTGDERPNRGTLPRPASPESGKYFRSQNPDSEVPLGRKQPSYCITPTARLYPVPPSSPADPQDQESPDNRKILFQRS